MRLYLGHFIKCYIGLGVLNFLLQIYKIISIQYDLVTVIVPLFAMSVIVLFNPVSHYYVGRKVPKLMLYYSPIQQLLFLIVLFEMSIITNPVYSN